MLWSPFMPLFQWYWSKSATTTSTRVEGCTRSWKRNDLDKAWVKNSVRIISEWFHNYWRVFELCMCQLRCQKQVTSQNCNSYSKIQNLFFFHKQHNICLLAYVKQLQTCCWCCLSACLFTQFPAVILDLIYFLFHLYRLKPLSYCKAKDSGSSL